MSDNEQLLLEKFSDLLTGGNAGTWDQIEHAIATLTAEAASLHAETERLRADNDLLRKLADFPLTPTGSKALEQAEARTRDLEAERTLAVKARDNWREAHDQVQARTRALEAALGKYDAAYRRVMEQANKLDSDVWYAVTKAQAFAAALTEPTQALRRAPADDAGQEREARGTH